MRISKDYWVTGPAGLVHVWYDFNARLWIVTRRAEAKENQIYGDQIGGAKDADTKPAAMRTAREMAGLLH